MMPDLKWDEHGLVPAIVQDWESGQVLMLAYVNREALQRTLETGQAHYWSRSRGELWHKGATSGHIQVVKSIRCDCDADTLLFQVEQTGAACHTGERSCFFRGIADEPEKRAQAAIFETARILSQSGVTMTSEPAIPAHTLDRLYSVILDRRQHPRDGSYTCRLFKQGNDEIAKKVGEEAVEVVLAAAAQGPERLTSEAADLIYHLMVLLAAHDLGPADLYRELEQRMKP